MPKISRRKRNDNKFLVTTNNKKEIFDRIRNTTDTDYKPEDDELTREALHQNYVVGYFLSRLNSDNTRSRYLNEVVQYCYECKMLPEQLIREAFDDDSENILEMNHIVKIENYLEYIREAGYPVSYSDGTEGIKHYSSTTLKTILSGLRKFYREFGIETPNNYFKLLPNEKSDDGENDWTPNKKIIRDIVDSSSGVLKAIILAQSSSGLAGIDLFNITIVQYENGKQKIKTKVDEEYVEETICMLEIKTREKNKNKNTDPFYTFFSIEACKEIDTYLKSRNTKPTTSNETTLLAYEKQRYDIDLENGKSLDDIYLFVKSEIKQIFLDERDERHRQITVAGYNYLLKTKAKNCGYTTKEFQWEDIRSHNLRKYFGNLLENSKNISDKKLVYHMMGHKMGTVKKAYYKAKKERLIKFYADECLPIIQFRDTETIQIIDSNDLKQQEKDRIAMLILNHELALEKAEEKKSEAESTDDILKYNLLINKYKKLIRLNKTKQLALLKNKEISEEELFEDIFENETE
ncbi:hypothetical protein [Methanolobus sp.]|uniref:hypothetical protein n=1 Tax=Methanolobus sp. TaxID=1874737 RepID=UPI0025D3210B|nr:hypothetical protein [Methanolobus sp.]